MTDSSVLASAHASVAAVGLGQEGTLGECLRERANLGGRFDLKYGSVHELESPQIRLRPSSRLMRYWQPNLFATPFPPPFTFPVKASTATVSVLDPQRQYQCVNRAIWRRGLVNGNIRLGRPI